jgi:NitT/TauT family transport system substrate-binding protein
VVGIGAPATADAAIEHGKVDAAVVGAAMVVLKQHHPDLIVLAESFSPDGVKTTLGTDEYPGAALLAKTDWLGSHQEVARRLTHAVVESLNYIQSHTPEEILARLPQAYRTDPETDLATMRAFLPDYSKTGKMNPGAAEAVRHVLAVSLEEVRTSQIDLATTWSNSLSSF